MVFVAAAAIVFFPLLALLWVCRPRTHSWLYDPGERVLRIPGQGKRLRAGILVAVTGDILAQPRSNKERQVKHVAGMGPLRLRLYLRPGGGAGEQ